MNIRFKNTRCWNCLLWFAGCLFSYFSCVDSREFDFSRLSLDNIHPTWVVPLVSDSIGLKTGEYIEFNQNNAVLVLNYKFTDASIHALDSLFNLPPQLLKWRFNLNIPEDQNGILSLSMNYQGANQLKFREMAKINSDLIRIDSIFVDSLNMEVVPVIVSDMYGDVSTTIYSLYQKSDPFFLNVPFPALKKIYQYNNLVLKLRQDSAEVKNLLIYKFGMNFNGRFKELAGATATIGCDALLKKLKISRIFSYIGKQNIPIQESIPVDIKGLTGSVKINSLDLKFEVNNSIGLPVALNINQLKVITPKGEVRTAQDFKTINILPADINKLGVPVKTIDSIDGTKLTPLFGSIPDKFLIDLTLTTNPRGEKPGKTNFLLNNSTFDLSAHIKAPLNLSLQDVVFADTVNFNLPVDVRKMMDDLYFRLKVTNHFPIAVYFQAVLLDEYGYPIGTLLDEPLTINSGKLDGVTSQIMESANLVRSIPFNTFKLDQLQHTKRIYFTVKANTSGNGDQKVKIEKKDFVVFKLGVSTKIHLNEVF